MPDPVAEEYRKRSLERVAAFTDAAGMPVAFERATFVKREAVAP